MLKKIFKTIWIIIVLLLLALFFFGVVRPAYINYKLNKKEVVVDTSGERATSKNKIKNEQMAADKNGSESSWKVEKKDKYDPFTFDDRILLYEGNLNSDSMKKLMNILIEDFSSKTFSKPNISLNGTDITYENKENYSSSLNDFKNSISQNARYTVKFEYNKLRTIVNKIVITNN